MLLMDRLAQLPAAARKALLTEARQHDPGSLLSVAHSRNGSLFPLSPGQRRLWILQQFEPESSAYNSVLAVRLSGKISVHHLAAAFYEMEKRHEIFRTSYPLINDEPMQMVHTRAPSRLSFIDLAALQPVSGEAWARGFLHRESCRPFDLSQLPLVRKALIAFSRDEYLLFVTMHHILADEWSTQLVLDELAELYEALKSDKAFPSSAPLIQYADFAVWQEMRGRNGAFNDQLEYWQKTLEGATELALPLDRDRALASYRGDVLTHAIPKKAAAWVYSFVKQARATLFMVLLAAFQIFLSHWTGQSDICVGTPVTNRNEPMIERTLGFLINTIVLRTQIDRRCSFRNFLDIVRETVIEALANQEAPFEMVIERIRPQRAPGSVPFLRTIFQTIPSLNLQWPDANATAVPVPRSTSKFDLTLFVRETPEALYTDWNYATDLLNRETIRQAAVRFAVLLQTLGEMPDTPLFRVLDQISWANV